MTGIPGPGRVVGSMLSYAGKRLEVAVDRFAEESLGRGPHVAALRLISALHEIHVQTNPGCRTDHVPGLNSQQPVTDRLIWVCNGFCSHCRFPYLPLSLTKASESVVAAISQLIKYLQPTQPLPNIGFSCLYIRLLVQSDVLDGSVYLYLNLLGTMKRTRDRLLPLRASYHSLPDDLVSLESAVAAVQQTTENERIEAQVRFPILKVRQWEEGLETPSQFFERTRNSGEWGVEEILFAQLMTWRTLLASYSPQCSPVYMLNQLMTQSPSSLKIPDHAAFYTHTSKSFAEAYIQSTSLVLSGHRNVVWSAACSYDGTKIISGSADTTVCVWDKRTGRQEFTLSGHTGEVNTVPVSPANGMLASGSDDRTIRLWDAQTTNPVAVFIGHASCVPSIAFSPDGTHIASGCRNHIVKLWDVGTGHASRALRGHSAQVNSVAFSPNGSYLASGSDDGDMKLWDLRAAQWIACLRWPTDWVYSVAFSPDGVYIASGLGDRSVRLWDTRSSRGARKLIGHNGWVLSVAFAPDGLHLVSGSVDTTARLWNLRTGQQIAILRGHSNWVSSAKFSPDGDFVVSSSFDGTIRLWDVSFLRLSDYGGTCLPRCLETGEAKLGMIPEDFEQGSSSDGCSNEDKSDQDCM